MKKMPTIFERDWNGDRSRVLPTWNPEALWVQNGEGAPYRKRDGTACKLVGGVLYRRYDAKKGKRPPYGALPCQPKPDPETGHWPHWLMVGDSPADKWYAQALSEGRFSPMLYGEEIPDGTYELCGPHFQANPEGFAVDLFISHDSEPLISQLVPRSFDGLRRYLARNLMEGVVWHHPDGRMAKIKRTDFGMRWPCNDDTSNDDGIY